MASGGIFRFSCPAGCQVFEQFCWTTDIAKQSCPICGAVGIHKRDDRMAHGADFSTPYLSRGMGVMPDQIEEARKTFPHHEFHPDGRMIIRSVRQLDQVRKDLGME